MPKLQDTDLFIVNRSNKSYQKAAKDLLDDIQDADLLLVNRSSKSYKLTGAQFKGSLRSAPIVRSAVLVEAEPAGDRFTGEEFTVTIDADRGAPMAYFSIKIVVAAELYDSETETTSSTELFAVLDSDFNIIDLQSADPGFTDIKGLSQTFRFRNIFPDGQAPDLSLLPGITIKAIVQATNLEFATVTEVTNTLIPNQLAQLNAATPADVTTYNTISTALQNYESNRDAVRAALKNTMLTNNFTEADISSINL